MNSIITPGASPHNHRKGIIKYDEKTKDKIEQFRLRK
jgi:hypothetical protein